MKCGWLVFALSCVAVVGFVPAEKPEQVVLLAGNFRGYLTPCGCTKPMSGGVLRMATAIRSLRGKSSAAVVLVGPWVAEGGRQSELKAEAVADFCEEVGADAWTITSGDIRLLGRPFWESTKARAKSMVLPDSRVTTATHVVVSTNSQQSNGTVIARDWDRDGAIAFAKGNDGSGTLVYTSATATSGGERVGGWTLVSPGEKGKSILRLTLREGVVSSVRSIELDAAYADDPGAKQVMAYYLRRVDREGLLDKLPRAETARYAGSESCASCHADAAKVWNRSKHSRALETLAKVGHDRDPDCVSCHVVGLDSRHGFTSVAKTRALANVGCESCHGPAKSHVEDPSGTPMGKVGAKSCQSCHVPQHSPQFRFAEYWKQIQH